jgi:hypothetical protein
MSTIDMPPIHRQRMPTSRTRWIFMVALSMVASSVLYGVYWWSSEFYGQSGPREHPWVKATLSDPEVNAPRSYQAPPMPIHRHGRPHTDHGSTERLITDSGRVVALQPRDILAAHGPVRLALPTDETRQYPARLDLSTVTSVLTSLAEVSTEEYQTDIYENELTTSGSVAREIIQTNMVSKEHRPTIEPSQNRHTPKHTATREQETRTDESAIVPARRNHDTHSTALEE